MESLDYNRSMGSSSPDADIYLSKNTKVLNDLPKLYMVDSDRGIPFRAYRRTPPPSPASLD